VEAPCPVRKYASTSKQYTLVLRGMYLPSTNGFHDHLKLLGARSAPPDGKDEQRRNYARALSSSKGTYGNMHMAEIFFWREQKRSSVGGVHMMDELPLSIGRVGLQFTKSRACVADEVLANRWGGNYVAMCCVLRAGCWAIGMSARGFLRRIPFFRHRWLLLPPRE